MRHGFTTGSCAAAAAKAAAYMLLFGIEKKKIKIMTPKGIVYEPDIVDISAREGCVSCAVVKDAGDDPDVTDGLRIFAEVSIKECIADGNIEGNVHVDIEGGQGVGVVTKPGLDQPPGNAAINSVPREMIKKEVMEVCAAADFHGVIRVVISVPGGEETAKRTFNPRLGIEGGISIIGTSGVVEPMSRQAIVDTIYTELRQHRALGESCACVTPGNYGLAFMKDRYGYDLDKSVRCSNFIGKTIDMAAALGFECMLLTGNIGKLVKLAGGIMNTHSAEADCRMEILACAALQEGVSAGAVLEIMKCVITEEALDIIKKEGRLESTMNNIMKKIMFYLHKRAAGRIEIQCVVYSNRFKELAKSEGADRWLTLLARDQAQQTL